MYSESSLISGALYSVPNFNTLPDEPYSAINPSLPSPNSK